MANENLKEYTEVQQAYRTLSESDKAIFSTIVNLAVVLLKGLNAEMKER